MKKEFLEPELVYVPELAFSGHKRREREDWMEAKNFQGMCNWVGSRTRTFQFEEEKVRKKMMEGEKERKIEDRKMREGSRNGKLKSWLKERKTGKEEAELNDGDDVRKDMEWIFYQVLLSSFFFHFFLAPKDREKEGERKKERKEIRENFEQSSKL